MSETRFEARDCAVLACGGGTAGILAATALANLGPLYWWFDLFSHFRVHYVITSLLLALGWIGLRAWRWLPAPVLLLAVNLAAAPPWPLTGPGGAAGDETLTVYYANVLSGAEAVHALGGQIGDAEPDVLVLLETTEARLDELGPVTDAFPFSEVVARDDDFGVAVFSRPPIREAEVCTLPSGALDLDVPAVALALDAPWGPTRLVAVHVVPPGSAEAVAAMDEQLEVLAGRVRQEGGSVLLVGDLNLTPHSHRFARFVARAGLHDSVRGWRSWTSGAWPAGLPALARIRIDHCLTSTDLRVTRVEVGEGIGSDHRPVVFEVARAP